MQVEKLKTIDADTLLSTPIRKTLFVVDGLIPQGLSVLSGSSKIGKSWLMLWLGIQVARGQPVWEFETHKSDVLYLCLEDTYARIQSRLYQITDEAPPELRIATTSFQIGNGLEQQIEQYLSDFPKTKLVIIDTFQKVRDSKSTGGKSGMYAGDYDDVTALKNISDKYGIPDKTIYSDICKALHYASDERKTVIGDEKAMYVTGVNCTAETAFAEMKAVQERFDKTVGNVAYHAYQSFKTGEVTPQLAHKLGVELAKRMWGDQYQVLVATHFNTGTYHNHLVINSVNMWNGKKFNCNEGAYWKLRSISDELCKENGLTVIKNPKGKTPRKMYFAEKNGELTRYNLMREAIDKALTMSTNPKVFTYVMKQLGYVIDLNPYHKYATIRSVNSKKATRLYRLGEGYDRDAIYDRMRDTLKNNPQEAYRLYYEFTEKKSFGVTIQKAHFVKGNLKTAKKITGLKALYFRYLYLLGVLPKNKEHKPLSPEMREACRWLDRHTAQVQLICDNHLTDISSVEVFIKNADSEIKLISDYRKMLYRDIDSCHNPDEKTKLVAKRDDCTKALAQLRKDKKTAARIIDDNPKIKENILIEENMRSRYFGFNKSRKRGYER